MKNAITVLEHAKKDLQTHNGHLSGTLKDSQQFTNDETEELRSQLKETTDRISKLNAKCLDYDQNKELLHSERKHFDERWKEMTARLTDSEKDCQNYSDVSQPFEYLSD